MNHVPESPDRRRRCARTDLADEIIRWDELPRPRRLELENHAATCASCGPALDLVRRAERWLASHGAATECPTADELFDYGGGPGATSLSAARHDAIELHVRACAECRGFVETLAVRPPVPLIVSAASDERSSAPPPTAAKPALAPAATTASRDERARATFAPRRAWFAFAAAAAVLLALGVLWRALDSGAAGSNAAGKGLFPAEDVLRGGGDELLYYPRGAVLARQGAAWHEFAFELAPRERASSYRIVVRRYDADPLAPGAEIARWTSPTASSTRPADAFGPGRYAWEAWAEVDGLDVRLGAQDFEVREDARVERALDAALALEGDARIREVLALLHREGYLGDARAFARTLPQSAERDAYLARVPGR
ncbi:MAG: hypothetical protein L6Q99_14405 [Planctomycetes bacterium]|nr:hypothetical protein [Planctomycetota bacterium]